MVLSNRLDNKPPRSLMQRTLLYVLGFGAGALLIAAGLSFAFVSIAEGVLPSNNPSAAAPELSAGQPVRIIGGPPPAAGRTGASPKRPGRANEATGAAKGNAGSSL